MRRLNQRGVRAITNRSGVKVVSLVPTPTGRAAAAEGTLERDFLTCCVPSGATDIIEQPVVIHFTVDPKTHELWLGHRPHPREGRVSPHLPYRKCIPDYLIQFRSRRPWLVQVSTERRRDNPDWEQAMLATRLYVEEQGWEFKLCTEADIRTEILERSRLLQRYQRLCVPRQVMVDTVRVLENTATPMTCRS